MYTIHAVVYVRSADAFVSSEVLVRDNYICQEWSLLSVRAVLITNVIISPRRTDDNCYYQSRKAAFPLVDVSTAMLLLATDKR